MAQVAFSHQFSHRWSNAPQAVKDALLQEFEDIMLLLEADTDLESFEFSVPDLHAHIDAINAEIRAEKEAEILENERQENERQEAERLQLEAEEAERAMLEQQAAEQQRVFDAEEAVHLESREMTTDWADSVNQESLPAEVIGIEEETRSTNEAESISSDEPVASETAADGVLAPQVTHATSVEQQQQQDAMEAQNPTADANTSPSETPITAPAEFAFDSSHSKAELDADFIKELENRIDDYLSEQLANMSEDLKSWLRDQVANRLSNK